LGLRVLNTLHFVMVVVARRWRRVHLAGCAGFFSLSTLFQLLIDNTPFKRAIVCRHLPVLSFPFKNHFAKPSKSPLAVDLE